ncbi:hypothetical protein ZHAS_00005888 [Anopheles sinensis]|uniref:Ionotropic glutamate receptor C-terminal domain-containing protein n=1 Tax=Anopheles sinensis TaxID=74873 RepID=A0A084VKI9_ANOSI|nr:hypothetical protein ZHAS_00005888 [Anopheles sinensis]
MNEQILDNITLYDVVGSGVLQSLREKPVNVQIVHQSWSYILGFIFRLTPEVNGVTREISSLSPFTGPVWLAILVVICFALAGLQLMGGCEKNYSPSSHNHFLIDMIGLIAQQGTTESSSRVPVRIALYAVLVMNFLLYNYYSASIVGELLSGINSGPRTIEELAKCPLKVTTPISEGTTSVPVYADVATAVRLLKQGGFAFHCEPTEAFRELAKQLDADEICELRTNGPLMQPVVLAGVATPFTILGGKEEIWVQN